MKVPKEQKGMAFGLSPEEADGSGLAAMRRMVLPEDPIGGPLEIEGKIALGSPDLYLNRELTWLGFCWRVLAEAEDVERVAIASDSDRRLYGNDCER